MSQAGFDPSVAIDCSRARRSCALQTISDTGLWHVTLTSISVSVFLLSVFVIPKFPKSRDNKIRQIGQSSAMIHASVPHLLLIRYVN